MTDAEVALFADTLDGVETYVEFGAGGSTTLAVQHGIASIWSIESDPKWIARLSSDAAIAAAASVGQLHLLHADIGPVEAWGFPAGYLGGALEVAPPVSAYHAGIWSRLDPTTIDVVLIDGRYRVATALAAIAHCGPHLRLIIHDFWARHWYAAVLEFATPLLAVDSLVIFTPRTGWDASSLERVLEQHRHSPH